VTRRLLLGYLSVTAFMLVILEVPLGATFARFERSNLIAAVRHDASTLALFAEEPLEEGRTEQLQQVVERYESATEGRAVVVDANGALVADSEPFEPGPRDFSSRPEVADALQGRETYGFRPSESLGTELLYVAVPVSSGGALRGAVRVTYPASYVQERIVRTWFVLAGVGLVVLAFVALLSLRVARSVTEPVRRLERAASALGEGKLSARAPMPRGPEELRVLTREFNDTAAKLERLVDAQRAFVADASHQLRTPLAALRLRLEMLEGDVDGRAREDVEGALAEVHRLSRLVNGLLELARAEHRAVAAASIDIGAVVADRVLAWGPLAEERNVSLVADVPPGTVALSTPGTLEQVLDNLVANALDVSPVGSTVTVRGANADGWVEVHVLDQGPGMPPERRATAFDRFWRAPDGEQRLGGFGIGLAIVRQLVVADGGHVQLLEAPGGGLDAVVRLRPAGGAPPTPRVARARPETRARAGGRSR
jgi:signal transduction histidine kinase